MLLVYTSTKKRIFLNNVIENIEVDYNEKEYLHHLRINFHLPVMRSIKELKTDVKLSTSALFTKPKPQLREGDQTCYTSRLLYSN